jgi:hypothetical protein
MSCICTTHANKINGHPGLQGKKAGFVVHTKKGWLGVSPDAWVTDPPTDP